MNNITIKIEAPEMAQAMNNLAQAITNMMGKRDELLAGIGAEKAVTKAKAKVEPTPTTSGPAVADLMALASAKAKLVGAEKVKEVIANAGGKTIKEVPEEGRIALKAALEALQ